jgi:hypothetical protein
MLFLLHMKMNSIMGRMHEGSTNMTESTVNVKENTLILPS